MPSIITHYLIGKRVLPMDGVPVIPRRDAFVLGLQGPDIFFFHRAYPWMPGVHGLATGNAIHEVQPSVLVDTMRAVLEQTPLTERDTVYSYILGFLCHYAADRMIHPFVAYWQEELMTSEPAFAKREQLYHYRIESALDTCILRREAGEYVSAFSLKTVLPKKDTVRDAILARFYHRLLLLTLNKDIPEKTLAHVTEDMRQSMGFMTDRTELKGKAIRFLERLTKSGAMLSTLLRTKEIERYDYANENRRLWLKGDNTVSKQTFYELYEETAAFAVQLLQGFAQGDSGAQLTNDIDFAGHPHQKEDTLDETDRKL